MAVRASFSPSPNIIGAGALTPPRFEDPRGWTGEAWSPDVLAALGAPFSPVQENQSFTHAAGVVRGLHFQKPPFAQAKMVRTPAGRFLSVIVDLRAGSPCFGAWDALEISGENALIHVAPKGCAHGVETLEARSVLAWVCDAPFNAEAAAGLHWRAVDAPWRAAPGAALLSERDAAWPKLDQVAPIRI